MPVATSSGPHHGDELLDCDPGLRAQRAFSLRSVHGVDVGARCGGHLGGAQAAAGAYRGQPLPQRGCGCAGGDSGQVLNCEADLAQQAGDLRASVLVTAAPEMARSSRRSSESSGAISAPNCGALAEATPQRAPATPATRSRRRR